MPGILDFGARLRIRTADDTADAFVLSTVLGEGVPALAAIPTGDGTEIDQWTGAVTIGSYRAEIVDVETSPGVRVFTSQLEDAGGYSQLLGRPARIDFASDGAWAFGVAGFVTSVVQTSALRWTVTVGESRRVELRAKAFAPRVTGLRFVADADGTAGSAITEPLSAYLARWPHRGALVGGPVTGPKPGQPGYALAGLPFVKQLGGWAVKIGQDPADAATTLLAAVRGYGPSDFVAKGSYDVLGPIGDRSTGRYRQVVPGSTLSTAPKVARYPDLAAIVTSAGGAAVLCAFADYPATSTDTAQLGGGTVFRNITTSEGVFVHHKVQYVTSQGTATVTDTLGARVVAPAGVTLPSGATATLDVISRLPTEASPLYWSGHPADLAALLWGEAGVAFDPDGIASARQAIGADERITVRMTDTPALADFLGQNIFTPFGLSVRPSASGWVLIPIRVARLLGAAAVSTSITAADVSESAPGELWTQEDSSVVTALSVDGVRFVPWPTDAPVDDAPPDGVAVEREHDERITGDERQSGARALSATVSGMLHTAGMEPDLAARTTALAQEVTDRAARGLRFATVSVRRGTAAHALPLGALAVLDLPHLPSRNRRRQDAPTLTQGRLVQLVQRTEGVTAAKFRLADAGPAVQAAALVPTLSLAAVANQRLRATVSVTNAAALVAAGAAVRLETARTTGAPPATGAGAEAGVLRLTDGTSQLLPALHEAGTLWVRGRVEPAVPASAAYRAGAWSAWTGVALAGLPAVSGLAAALRAEDGGSAVLTWGAPAGGWDAAADIATAVLEVWWRRTSDAAGDGPAGTSTRALMLPAQSTQAVLALLPLGVGVTVAVVLRDAVSGALGTAAVATVTTGTTAAALPAVARTAGYVTALHAVGLGVEAGTVADRLCDVEVAAEIETDVGSGVYVAATSSVTAGLVGDWTVPMEIVPPQTGRRVRLRARNRRPDSAGVGDGAASGDAGAWSAWTVLDPTGAAVALPSFVGAGTPGVAGPAGGDGPPGAPALTVVPFGDSFSAGYLTRDGNTFTRSAFGGENWTYVGVRTADAYSAGAAASAAFGAASAAFGVTRDLALGSYERIEFSWVHAAGGSEYVAAYAGSSLIYGTVRSYDPADRLAVHVVADPLGGDGVVHYLVNGASVESRPAPAGAYYGRAAWGNHGGTLRDFGFAPGAPAGTAGVNGDPGLPGLDGTPRWVWRAYANSADGTDAFTLDRALATDRLYLGIATNQLVEAEGTDPDVYTWTRIKGDRGEPGLPGASSGTPFATAAVVVHADTDEFELVWMFAEGFSNTAIAVQAAFTWFNSAGQQTWKSADHGGVAFSGQRIPAGQAITDYDPGAGYVAENAGAAFTAWLLDQALGGATAGVEYWINDPGTGGPGGGGQIVPNSAPVGGA